MPHDPPTPSQSNSSPSNSTVKPCCPLALLRATDLAFTTIYTATLSTNQPLTVQPGIHFQLFDRAGCTLLCTNNRTHACTPPYHHHPSNQGGGRGNDGRWMGWLGLTGLDAIDLRRDDMMRWSLQRKAEEARAAKQQQSAPPPASPRPLTSLVPRPALKKTRDKTTRPSQTPAASPLLSLSPFSLFQFFPPRPDGGVDSISFLFLLAQIFRAWMMGLWWVLF
ncbi:hypothetical protein IWZ01DRAFT_174952 [Phyllosticta capitalensis]